ncbi:MAG: hypothetical protein AAGI66_03285 [Cyanobacteria bacterium P01_H01_bin.74]
MPSFGFPRLGLSSLARRKQKLELPLFKPTGYEKPESENKNASEQNTEDRVPKLKSARKSKVGALFLFLTTLLGQPKIVGLPYTALIKNPNETSDYSPGPKLHIFDRFLPEPEDLRKTIFHGDIVANSAAGIAKKGDKTLNIHCTHVKPGRLITKLEESFESGEISCGDVINLSVTLSPFDELQYEPWNLWATFALKVKNKLGLPHVTSADQKSFEQYYLTQDLRKEDFLRAFLELDSDYFKNHLNYLLNLIIFNAMAMNHKKLPEVEARNKQLLASKMDRWTQLLKKLEEKNVHVVIAPGNGGHYLKTDEKNAQNFLLTNSTEHSVVISVGALKNEMYTTPTEGLNARADGRIKVIGLTNGRVFENRGTSFAAPKIAAELTHYKKTLYPPTGNISACKGRPKQVKESFLKQLPVDLSE